MLQGLTPICSVGRFYMDQHDLHFDVCEEPHILKAIEVSSEADYYQNEVLEVARKRDEAEEAYASRELEVLRGSIGLQVAEYKKGEALRLSAEDNTFVVPLWVRRNERSESARTERRKVRFQRAKRGVETHSAIGAGEARLCALSDKEWYDIRLANSYGWIPYPE